MDSKWMVMELSSATTRFEMDNDGNVYFGNDDEISSSFDHLKNKEEKVG